MKVKITTDKAPAAIGPYSQAIDAGPLIFLSGQLPLDASGAISGQDIDRQVRNVVERMGAPEGGLMVAGSVWDGLTSLENIEALCTAMEKYCLKAT